MQESPLHVWMAPLCMQVWVGLAGSALLQAASDTPPRKGAGQAGVRPAQDWRGGCAPACQPHPGSAKHAGG